ncbi:hypothetical protein OE88DRAFT_1334476 [Heliocybe sulcata]|uniref:F-box domain-containing protein n=1 Tax=Heliocybe sulcata TaxID=5364 RepID=A0A5C3N6X4_9AGAM|nr:hypothetical protein OE88DRAFT_1334476 [Heliocybe sulcata]
MICEFYMDTNAEKPSPELGQSLTTPSAADWYNYRFRVTHVCHRWREVALQHPCLWSDIAMTSLECFRELLFRSKAVSLFLSWETLEDNTEGRDILGLIFTELHRIKSLDLGAPNAMLKELQGRLPKTALRLRRLGLYANNDDEDGQPIHFISSLDLPQLEVLEVDRYPLSSSQMLLVPSLTALLLCRIPSGSDTKSLLTLLRNTPLLSSLSIWDPDGKLLVRSAETSLEPVRLLHLEALNLFCHLTLCAQILTDLKFPKNICIAMYVLCYDITSETQSARSQALINRIRTSFTSDFLRAFYIGCCANDELPGLTFGGWSRVPRELDTPGLSPKLHLTFCGSKDSESLLALIGRRLPLGNVTYLCVQECEYYTLSRWRSVFLRMVNVTTLHVHGGVAASLPAALHVHENPATAAQTATPVANDAKRRISRLFPHLQYLRLQGVSFLKDIQERTPDDFIEQLKKALGCRKKRRCPLAHLDVRDASNFLQADADHLRKVVGKVTYAGTVKE